MQIAMKHANAIALSSLPSLASLLL